MASSKRYQLPRKEYDCNHCYISWCCGQGMECKYESWKQAAEENKEPDVNSIKANLVEG